jgi:hypothetical protein
VLWPPIHGHLKSDDFAYSLSEDRPLHCFQVFHKPQFMEQRF